MAKIFFILILLLGISLPGWAEDTKAANIWSGVEQVLPISGEWRLTLLHGRQIAFGVGQVKLNIPPLEADTSLEADLVVDKVIKRIKIWSRQLLNVSRWQFNESGNNLKKIFDQYAIGNDRGSAAGEIPLLISDTIKFETGKTTICIIPEKNFPFRVDFDWNEMTCGIIDNNDGNLGIDALQNGELINLRGKWSYVELKKQDTQVFVVSSKVDFSKPDAVLWLRNIANIVEKKANAANKMQ